MQGHLGTLHTLHNLSRSGVVPEVSPGGWRYPHVDIGLAASALAVAHDLNSRVNWVGRPRQVARRRPGPEMAMGKILVNSLGGRTTQLGMPKARK